MGIKKDLFGMTKEGKEAYIFTLENSKGMKVQVTNYGTILVSLFVKNKLGELKDIVLGYDKLEDYFSNDFMFGATVGRNVNRIENAKFEIDGIVYHLVKNKIVIIFIVIRKSDFTRLYGILRQSMITQ